MNKFRMLPDWVQALIALGGLLVALTFGWAGVKNDIRMEASERKHADERHEEQHRRFEKGIERIEQLFREEMERHHPRQQ